MKISEFQAKNLLLMGAVWNKSQGFRIKNPSLVVKEALITIYKPHQSVKAYKVDKQDLIFHNSDYCIVYKRPFSASHPTPYSDTTSLLNGLQDFFNKPVFPVNRLDFITGGLIFFALNKNTGKKLQNFFQNRKIKKWYVAKTEALDSNKKYFFINTPITQKNKSKTAKTIVTLLGETESENYFLVKPLTGRTHQIRIHLAQALSPIRGDKQYGGKAAKESGLFCIRYFFPDPKDGKLRKICYIPEEVRHWPINIFND